MPVKYKDLRVSAIENVNWEQCDAKARGQIGGKDFVAHHAFVASNGTWAWAAVLMGCSRNLTRGELCAISRKLYTVAKVEGINLKGR